MGILLSDEDYNRFLETCEEILSLRTENAKLRARLRFPGLGVRPSMALTTLGWDVITQTGPNFTDEEFMRIPGAGRKALLEARDYIERQKAKD